MKFFLNKANELPVQPDFCVNNFGQLEFPLNESRANDLIKVCKPTSFSSFNDSSQSEADVIRDVDLRVCDSFELDPSEFEIKNPEWQIKIDLLAQQAAEHLSHGFKSMNPDGEKKCPVSAILYRMLLYKINGHFGRHRDRIKEKNQFGTLVVQMPCKYTGGEFIAYKPDNTKEYCDLGQSSGKNFLRIKF